MRSPFNIKRIAIVLSGLILALPARAESVEVLCNVQEWCEVAKRGFFEATGIQVNMTKMGSRKVLELLAAERDRPRHDVWFGGTGEFHLEAARQKLTLAYRSPNNSLLHPWGARFAEQSGYRTNGIYSGPLSFVYNAQVLGKAQVAPPRCWADLVKPEYRGLVQLAHPTGVYSVISTLVQLMGEDDAFRYVRQLHSNVPAKGYARNGTDALEDVARGDAAIAIAFVYGVNADFLKSGALQMASPCEGTGYEIGGMSIIKGGPNPNGAKRFFDWALTAEAQKLMGPPQPFDISSNRNGRLDGRVVDPPPARLIDYDFVKYGSLDERMRLLKKWEQTVGAAPTQ